MSIENQAVIDAVKEAQKSATEVAKSFTQPGSATTGLQQYNLEAPAKSLVPVFTPLRNSIARETGGFNIQANWKYCDGVNVSNMRAGVSQGKRAGVITQSIKDAFATFKGWGLENSVTFEADYASKGYDDLRSRAVLDLLKSVMIQEERLILGGNTSVALGTTPTPTLATASGGNLPAATYSVIAVALGLQAYLDVVGVNNGAIGQSFSAASTLVPGSITRTNADGSTDTFGGGSAQKSASATIAVSASGKISASVAAVSGAVGYAWFVGAAGSEALVAVTSINSVVITDVAPGGAQLASALSAADNSTCSLDFDGLLYQAVKSGSGAIVKTMATGTAGVGTPLTSDGAGGIVEFEDVLLQMWNKYRVSPTKIYVSSQELINISAKVIGNKGAPLIRFSIDPTKPEQLVAGVTVAAYLNKVTGQLIPLVIHPNMPAGTVLFYSESLPYPVNGVANVAKMAMRQDYFQIEWPLKSRQYEYGVYADGVLQHYAPFSMAVITNIANG